MSFLEQFLETNHRRDIITGEPIHEGKIIYTNIEDLVENKKYKIQIPEYYLFLKNIQGYSDEEQEYMMSFGYPDKDNLVFTTLTIHDMIDAVSKQIAFIISKEEDILEIAEYLQTYYNFGKKFLNHHFTNDKLKQKDLTYSTSDITKISEQIKLYLSTIETFLGFIFKKVRILFKQHPDWKEFHPTLVEIPDTLFSNYTQNNNLQSLNTIKHDNSSLSSLEQQLAQTTRL